MYNDGGVEKYEGLDAFNFIEQIIQKYRLENPSPIAQQPHIQEPPIQQPPIQHNKTKNTASAPNTLILKHDPDKMVSEIVDPEDDTDEVHNNIEMEDIFPPPKAMLRNGPGSYEIDSEFGEKNIETKVTKGIKAAGGIDISGMGNKKTGKKSIMESAMEMQKSREVEIDSSPRAPFP
jgi:hypothetical protein